MLAASKTLASPCVLVKPDGWARGEREGYGEPCDVTSLSLSYGACVEYAGKMWPERTEVQKIPREEDLDPSRVYAFRKFVQELLIPAGVVDMAALASRGGGPRFLHAMWTLYEHC